MSCGPFKRDSALPIGLSFVAGYVDTVGFIALFGLFTAHVTGNFVLIGSELARSSSNVLLKLLVFPAFIVAVAFARILEGLVQAPRHVPDVRGRQHIGQRPERMVRGQGLDVVHVHGSTRNSATPQGSDQCLLIDDGAAGCVDETGACFRPIDRIALSDARGDPCLFLTLELTPLR